jgi:type II secretory pathway pseudopilin PulG
MRNLDFSSWQALLSTLVGLAVVSLIMVGIRLLLMQTVQHKRERENRQINERLRTLIAAYKTLGGSFTGNLAVDPTHLRDLHQRDNDAESVQEENTRTSSDRSRRTRDAVEAALSDIVLLGTEEQVRLAANAATELAEGRPTHTAELVVSLRNFIRQVLDLEAIPDHLSIPRQGPLRTTAGRGKGEGAAKDAGKSGGGARGMGGGGMGGGGMGMGMRGNALADEQDHHR